MDANLKQAKQDIRAFWPNYSDERLVWLLAHARDGKLEFSSCCCFVGIATADHDLQTLCVFELSSEHPEIDINHLERARRLPNAEAAEDGFRRLATEGSPVAGWNDTRLVRLIPMIKAEMRRRERERARLAGDTNHTSELAGVLLKS